MTFRVLSFAGLCLFACLAQAQSMDEILEQARERALEIEKMKKVMIEEPDPNVRLAAFELMTQSRDPTMVEVAIDVGLSSADSLLQAAALKAAVMNLESIHVQLVLSKSADHDKQAEARDYLKKKGSDYIIKIGKKDPSKGTFSKGNTAGELVGTQLNFTKQWDKGTLSLEDGNRLVGKITLYHTSYIEFDAEAVIH